MTEASLTGHRDGGRVDRMALTCATAHQAVARPVRRLACSARDISRRTSWTTVSMVALTLRSGLHRAAMPPRWVFTIACDRIDGLIHILLGDQIPAFFGNAKQRTVDRPSLLPSAAQDRAAS